MGCVQLPNDVLLIIFEYIAELPYSGEVRGSIECRQTLEALSHVSRNFYQLVGPLLYQELELCHDSCQQPFRKLLRALSTRPDASSMIRTLDVDFWLLFEEHFSGLDEDPGKNPLEPVEYNVLREAVHKTQASKKLRKRLLRQLLKGSEDAELATILVLCPKIEQLGLNILPRDFNNTVVNHVFQEAARFSIKSTDNFLTHLTHIEMGPLGDMDCPRVTWRTMSNLFTLSSLEVMSLDRIDCRSASALEIGGPKVGNLVLFEPCLSPRGMKAILDTFPALKSLSMTWTNDMEDDDYGFSSMGEYEYDYFGEDPGFDNGQGGNTIDLGGRLPKNDNFDERLWPAIQEVLIEHGKSLELLRIKMPSGFEYRGTVQGLKKPLPKGILEEDDTYSNDSDDSFNREYLLQTT